MQIKKENLLEIMLLVAFTGIMLWTGLADSWGHKITHEHPYSYLASDTFQHQTRAQWIKEAGNYKYEAPYYSAGFKDVTGFYPPILNHITALFSHISGIEVYDSILFLTVILAIFGALIFYITIRQWNKQIAILSLPLMTYIFTIREARNAFFWGNWPALLGDFFLIATLWMMINLKKEKASIFLAIFLTGTILGHTSATIFTLIFILIFTAVMLYFKKFGKHEIKTIIIAVIISLVSSTQMLVIFKQAWMVAHPFTFHIMTDWSGGGGFITLKDFGYSTLTIMAIGLLILLLSKQKNNYNAGHNKLIPKELCPANIIDDTPSDLHSKNIKNLNHLLYFQKTLAIFTILAGFTNYIGFENRAFNFRFYWPIMLSICFGTGSYKILTTLTNITKRTLTTTTSIVVSLLLIILLINNNYVQTNDVQGLMNPYTWQTINWLKQNTEKNDLIFFFYGDPYDQDGSLGNTERLSTRVEISELANALQAGAIKRNFPTKQLVEMGAHLPYKKGMLSFGLHYSEEPTAYDRQIRDLCNFNYYVFDKFGRFPPLIKFNEQIIRSFMEKKMALAFENPLNIVLKNPQKGGDCFGANNTIAIRI